MRKSTLNQKLEKSCLRLENNECYIKCKDEHTDREFQVKKLFHAGTVYFEFSCGCCIKYDKAPNQTIKEDISDLFTDGLITGLSGKFLTKKNSLWSPSSFEKTPHRCCAKDAELIPLLTKMAEKIWHSFLSAGIHRLLKKNIRGMSDSTIRKSIEKLKKSSTDNFSDFCEKVMPLFQNTGTMPQKEELQVHFYKDRKLPEQMKIFLQVKAPEKALTDEQLVELFEGTAAQKERRPKFHKKKPNKGKSPNAIRKTQKPAKL